MKISNQRFNESQLRIRQFMLDLSLTQRLDFIKSYPSEKEQLEVVNSYLV